MRFKDEKSWILKEPQKKEQTIVHDTTSEPKETRSIIYTEPRKEKKSKEQINLGNDVANVSYPLLMIDKEILSRSSLSQ